MVVSATPRGNLASVFFGEFSQIGSNFGESEDSMDSPTSINVNALMADSTDMDKKFAMMDQTIETLKKSVDDKNLHIYQLMNKLEAFTPGESSHVPTCPSGFDQQNKDVEESLGKSKFQKEKQSASVAALSSLFGFHLRGAKEITSSHYTSIEKTKESKEGKTPQRTSIFERIGRLTPRVSVFERLGRNDKRGSSKQVDEYATTSKTSIFHRLGTKRKSLFERRLLEHENQDSCV
uniref:Uncharacterized protein n=1 Tax=Solanum tuberosum TaxID=4113 RepID=M1DUY2_SOLTU